MAVSHFVPDEPGAYQISLLVSDGAMTSTDNITVTVASLEDAMYPDVQLVSTILNDAESSAFKNKNMGRTLANKISIVFKLYGDRSRSEALVKLTDDILAKLSGCARTAAPDKDDWIVDCTLQTTIASLLAKVQSRMDPA